MNILVAILCLVGGVVLGFLLSTLFLFGGYTLPGLDSTPDANAIGSVSYPLPANAETARLASPARQSPSSGSAPTRQKSSSDVVTSGLSYSELSATSAESSIADQQRALEVIANANLEQIMQSLAEIPVDNNRIHEQQWVIGLLTQRRIELDPAGAFSDMQDSLLDQGAFRQDNLATYLLQQNLSRQQPGMMIEWLGSLPDNSVDPDSLMSLYAVLAQSAPESAIEMIRQNPVLASNRYGGVEAVLYMWSEKDPEGALQWLEQQGDQQLLTDHVTSIVSIMADRDPEGARLAARNFAELIPEEVFMVREIHQLAETDPLAAYAMAESIADSDEAMGAKNAVFFSWGMSDPVAAFEFINSLPDERERQMFAQMIAGPVGSMVTRSAAQREELLVWSETLSPEVRQALREPLMSNWVEQEPQAAIDWLSSQPESIEKSRLMQSIAWFIPEHNLQQAMDLYAVANTETQMALTQGILRQLYQSEPESAWRWYDELPDNDIKQASLYELVMMTAQTDPQQALILAGNSQEEMLPMLLQMIGFENPEIVDNWLITADLPEGQKTEIRDMIANSQREMSGYPPPGAYGHYPPGMSGSTLYRIGQ